MFLQIINCNIYQAAMLSDIVSKSIDGMLVVVNMYFETLYKIIKIYSKILLYYKKMCIRDRFSAARPRAGQAAGRQPSRRPGSPQDASVR